jgi:hypothetical protein
VYRKGQVRTAKLSKRIRATHSLKGVEERASQNPTRKRVRKGYAPTEHSKERISQNGKRRWVGWQHSLPEEQGERG